MIVSVHESYCQSGPLHVFDSNPVSRWTTIDQNQTIYEIREKRISLPEIEITGHSIWNVFHKLIEIIALLSNEGTGCAIMSYRGEPFMISPVTPNLTAGSHCYYLFHCALGFTPDISPCTLFMNNVKLTGFPDLISDEVLKETRDLQLLERILLS